MILSNREKKQLGIVPEVKEELVEKVEVEPLPGAIKRPYFGKEKLKDFLEQHYKKEIVESAKFVSVYTEHAKNLLRDGEDIIPSEMTTTGEGVRFNDRLEVLPCRMRLIRSEHGWVKYEFY